MKRILLFILFTPLYNEAQYSFSGYKQSYSYLTGASTYYTLPWDETTPFLTSIPIGFTFYYFGQAITTINPTGVGVINLGDGTQFDAYMNIFGASLRSKGIQSPIKYKTEGPSGMRIFKFEVNNAGFYYEYDSTNVVNHQLWLYEGSNIIEYHYGPGKYRGGATIYQLEFGPSIGLSYFNGTAEYQLRLIHNPYWPDTITDLSSEQYVAGGPWDSLVYKFIPSGFNGLKSLDYKVRIALYPNPVTDKLVITAEEEIQTAQLHNMLGEKVMEQKVEGKRAEIDVAALPQGLYVVKLQGKDFERTTRVIKQDD